MADEVATLPDESVAAAPDTQKPWEKFAKQKPWEMFSKAPAETKTATTAPRADTAQIGAYTPTIGQRASDAFRSLRTSGPVEKLMGRTEAEKAAIPALESAPTTSDEGVMGLFTNKKQIIPRVDQPKTVMQGVQNLASEIADSVASPGSIALMAATGGGSAVATAEEQFAARMLPVAKKLTDLGFRAQGVKMVVDAVRQNMNDPNMTTGQLVENIGHALIGAAMGGRAFKGKVKTPIESEAPNAEAIRGNQGQLRTPGEVAQGGEEAGGNDVEQKPPGQPQPVVAGETTPPEAQAGSLPLTAVPAIKTGDTITTGTHHVDAYQRAREAGIADTSGSQEGFLDNGVFKTREQYAADHPEVPTTVEQGKTHSEDLAKAKTEPTAVDKTIAEKVFSQQYPEDLTRAGIPSGKINSTEGAMGALINELRRSDKPVEVINAWAKMWKSMQARQKKLKTGIETDPKSLIEYMGMGFKTQLPREALENIADFGQREFPSEVVQAAQKALGRKTKQPVKPVSTSPAPARSPLLQRRRG